MEKTNHTYSNHISTSLLFIIHKIQALFDSRKSKNREKRIGCYLIDICKRRGKSEKKTFDVFKKYIWSSEPSITNVFERTPSTNDEFYKMTTQTSGVKLFMLENPISLRF